MIYWCINVFSLCLGSNPSEATLQKMLDNTMFFSFLRVFESGNAH